MGQILPHIYIAGFHPGGVMREALYDIYIYGEKGKAAPLIVMNTFQGNGSDVYSALCTMTEKELNLAVISDINWNEEMSP